MQGLSIAGWLGFTHILLYYRSILYILDQPACNCIVTAGFDNPGSFGNLRKALHSELKHGRIDPKEILETFSVNELSGFHFPVNVRCLDSRY